MPDDPTPRLGLHRPVGGDDADVPFDLGELTDQLDSLVPYDAGARASRGAASPDGRIYRSTDGGVDLATGSAWLTVTPPILSSLPDTPDDGMVVDLVVDTAGTYGGPHLWRCRYRAATDGAYKWHVFGGAPFVADASTPTDVSLTLVHLITINVPYSGYYVASGSLTLNYGGVVQTVRAGVVSDAGDLGRPFFSSGDVGSVSIAATEQRLGAVSSSVGLAARTSSGTVYVGSRALSVRPVRIG